MAIPPCSVEYFNPATQQCYQSSNPPSIPPPMPPLPSVQLPPSISWVTHTHSPPLHMFPPPLMPPSLDASCRFSHHLPLHTFPPPLMPPSLDASCRFSHHPPLHNLQRVMHPYNQAPVNLVHHPAGGGNNIRGFGSPMQPQQHGYHVQHGHQASFHMEYGRWGYGGIASPSVPAHLSHEQGHRPFVQFQQNQVLQEIPYQNEPQAPTFTFHPHPPQQLAPLQQVPPQQYCPSNIPSHNCGGSSNIVRPIPIYSSQIPPRFEVHASTPPSGAVPMMPVPVMERSAGGSMQPPIIETQDLLPVQAPMTAQSQEQLIGVIEIQKDSSSSDTPGLVDPNTSACAPVYIVDGTVDAIQQTIEVETTELSSEEAKETEEYKEFATTFKSEQTELGYTQATPVLQEIPYQNEPQAPTFTFHPHPPQQQAPLQQVPPQQYCPSNIPSHNCGGSSNIVRPIPSQIPPRFEVHAPTPPSGAVPMTPIPVMERSAGGSIQPPIIETQDLLPVQAPMTAQSQEQLIGVIEIQKDSSSSDTPGLVDPNTSACAPVYTVEGTVDAIQQTVEVETTELSSEEAKETEEYKEFATTFKSERTKLSYTQADVMQQVRIRYGVSFSQDTLVQFEAGELPLETARSIKSVIEEWLRDSLRASNVSEEKIKEILYPTTIVNPFRERKKRLLDKVTRNQLENEFRKKKKPNQNELQHIADHIQIKKDFVQVWFCNRRQRERKKTMKGHQDYQGQS